MIPYHYVSQISKVTFLIELPSLTWRQAAPSQSQPSTRSRRKVRPCRDDGVSHPCVPPVWEKQTFQEEATFQECVLLTIFQKKSQAHAVRISWVFNDNKQKEWYSTVADSQRSMHALFSAMLLQETNFPGPPASRWTMILVLTNRALK